MSLENAVIQNSDTIQRIPKKIRKTKTINTFKEKHRICSICQKKFGRLSHLKDHMLVHTGVEAYKCEICQKSFKQKLHLNRHKLTHSAMETINVYFCDTCQEGFANFTDFRIHQVTHGRQNPKLRCSICSEIFNRAMKLRDHMKMMHSIHSKMPCQKIRSPYICDICGKQYSKEDRFTRHKLSHSGQQQTFICTKCRKQYSRKDKLKRHSRTFHEHSLCTENKIVMNVNKIDNKIGQEMKRPAGSGNLIVDTMLTQNKAQAMPSERPMHCPVCDKRFPSAYRMRDHHIRCHTPGISQDQCDICLKKFTTLLKLEKTRALA